MSTWKKILAVIAIFILGTVFGLVIYRQITPGLPPPPDRPFPILSLQQMDQLLDQELSAGQKEEISKILDEARSDLEGLRKQARPEIGRTCRKLRDVFGKSLRRSSNGSSIK